MQNNMQQTQQTQQTLPCAVFPLSLVRKALETSRNKMNRVNPEKYNSIVYAPKNCLLCSVGNGRLLQL